VRALRVERLLWQFRLPSGIDLYRRSRDGPRMPLEPGGSRPFRPQNAAWGQPARARVA